MDHGLLELFKLGASVGTTSLVLILWYWSSRDTARILEVYRKDLSDVLKKYDGDMLEVRRMYESNVELVKQTLTLAQDLKEVLVLNTSKWQATKDAIQANEFCPLGELRRKMKGVVE